MLDIRLRDGNPEKQTFKATLGASEVSLSGSGHIGEKTSYLFSLRQSYLQLLFKMIGLPFLPNYIDGQLKVKTRLSEHDELTVLGLAGFDNMKLNLDEEGEDRVPAELPAPHPPGDLHRRGLMAPLCGPPCADRVARAHLSE